jgi:hypothetical protein
MLRRNKAFSARTFPTATRQYPPDGSPEFIERLLIQISATFRASIPNWYRLCFHVTLAESLFKAFEAQ